MSSHRIIRHGYQTRWFHAILMPVIIEFSRCIGTYSSAKFELRDTLRYYDLNEEVQDFVEWFFDSELYGCCVELMTLDNIKYLSKEFLENYKNSDE